MAQELFNKGNYDAALSFLNVKTSGLSSEQIEMSLLLAGKIYGEFKDKNYEKIDSISKMILKNNPNFDTKYIQNEYELLKSLSSFHVKPLFTIGLSLGANKPFVQQKTIYSIDDSIAYSTGYQSTLGSAFGIQFSWQPLKRTIIRSSASLSRFNLQRNIEGNQNYIIRSIAFEEKARTLDFSLGARVTFFESRFKPFVGIDVGLSHLLESIGKVELNYFTKDRDNLSSELRRISSEETNIQATRNANRIFISPNIGLLHKINNMIIGISLDYNFNIHRYNKEITSENNNEIYTNYMYVDNEIRMTNLTAAISLSYVLKHKVTHD
jgi:hypothetical protein